MSKSTSPTDLLHPAAAMALWAELRPDPPPTAHAFHTRAERLGVAPCMVKGVRHYSVADLEAAILGREARAALDLARTVKLAGELGFTIHFDAREDDPPAVEILSDGDDVGLCYSGHLAGARQWLEDVVRREEGEAAP